jgi:hypothetical protein
MPLFSLILIHSHLTGGFARMVRIILVWNNILLHSQRVNDLVSG